MPCMPAMKWLGWPGRWSNGQLFNDGGLPVHLCPFPLGSYMERMRPEYDRYRTICWCSFEACVGSWDELGFPR